MSSVQRFHDCLSLLITEGVLAASSRYIAQSVARLEIAQRRLQARGIAAAAPPQNNPKNLGFSYPHNMSSEALPGGSAHVVFGDASSVDELESLDSFKGPGLIGLLAVLTHKALQMGHTRLPLQKDAFELIFHHEALQAQAERGERNQARDRSMSPENQSLAGRTIDRASESARDRRRRLIEEGSALDIASEGDDDKEELVDSSVDSSAIKQVWVAIRDAIEQGELERCCGAAMHLSSEMSGPDLPPLPDAKRAPLILSSHRQGRWLALDRAWVAEREIHGLFAQASQSQEHSEPFALPAELQAQAQAHIAKRLASGEAPDSYFPGSDDHSRFAAFAALTHPISFVHGGPGTGKTTLAQRIISILLELQSMLSLNELRIAITAPTGKAAVRVREAIYQLDLDQLFYALDPSTRDKLFELNIKGITLHRLLKFHPDRPHKLAFDSNKPLPFDVIIVDEASMLDLPLCRALCRALPSHWGRDPMRPLQRMILLGDPDQLPPVGEGAVWRDLCRDGQTGEARVLDQGTPIAISSSDRALFEQLCPGVSIPNIDSNKASGSSAQLVRNYRIKADGDQEKQKTLSQLFDFVKRGQANEAIELIEAHHGQDKDALFSWIQLHEQQDIRSANQTLKKNKVELFLPDQYDVYQDWKAHRTKVITELRDAIHNLHEASPDEYIDRYRELELKFKEELILCAQYRGPFGVEFFNESLGRQNFHEKKKTWKAHPILILKNHTKTNLYNGDIGFMYEPKEGDSIAYFEGVGDELGSVRSISSGRLPNHSHVYAMSVHKSQGSEFDEVTIALPAYPSPLLTRELFYTAITRTKNKVRLIASRDALRRTIERPTWRFTIGPR